MDQTQQFKDLQALVTKLQASVDSLSGVVNKNSFSSTQTFAKDCVFYARLKVPSYSVAPTVSEVGDLIEVGGKLYICTVANSTFTLVGSQT